MTQSPLKYRHAICRVPPLSMAQGITTQQEMVDIHLARKQHQSYLDVLKSLEIDITLVEPEEALPDSHFVEDAAIIYRDVAILTNPGAEERKLEVAKIQPILEKKMSTIPLSTDPVATLDGGDVLFLGKDVLVGVSYRTSYAGCEALAQILRKIDPTLRVHAVEFDGVLHLKSGFVALNEHELLGNPAIKLTAPLPVGMVNWLPVGEGYAANALVANGALLHFAECSSAAEVAKRKGLQPIALDMSEFRKMDGSFTCLSLLW